MNDSVSDKKDHAICHKCGQRISIPDLMETDRKLFAKYNKTIALAGIEEKA